VCRPSLGRTIYSRKLAGVQISVCSSVHSDVNIKPEDEHNDTFPKSYFLLEVNTKIKESGRYLSL
ncbi:hypothetical protein L9F63_024668, partial [Diploptera punctata]